jgi:CheY-like chemotaxis protein
VALSLSDALARPPRTEGATAQLASPRNQPGRPAEPANRLTGTVLVVDDDDLLRHLLHETLESEGYPVIAARDGVEALARVEASSVRLILLDWTMPRMDGRGFVAELERRDLRRGLAIIVLTAAGQAAHYAAQIRAEGFLAKPFDLSELLNEVERFVQPG